MSDSRPVFSLVSLQAFVAVARLGSFTRAADSVCLTQSAVSKHIRLIENSLGAPVFSRVGGVALTETGRQFLIEVEPALDQILRAMARAAPRVPAPAVVHLLAPPAMLQYWLVPLLPAFHAQHPQIELRLSRRLLAGPQTGLGVDAEVRFGSGNWQGVSARYLFGREMCVVASPAWLAEHAVSAPADLRAAPLLRHVLYPAAWEEWGQAMGAGAVLAPVQEFDHYAVMIEAVKAGLGVGIVPRLLVRQHLADGHLVAPFNEVMVGTSGYYLLLGEAGRDSAHALQTLGDWMKAQADALVSEWLRRAQRTVVYSGQRH